MNRNFLYLSLFLLSGLLQAYTRDEGWVNGKAEGIAEITVDLQSGRVLSQRPVVRMVNPSFVLESKNERYLYAVSEMAREGEASGSLIALDTKDDYRKVSELPTGGKAPCHIAVDATGKMLMTANYLGGVAKAYLQKADGTLVETDKFEVPEGLIPGKQPHLHSSNFSPSNRIVAVADLGLDRIWLFNPNPNTGKITPHAQGHVQLAGGAGPRHTEWSADGQFLYVINELNGTVNVLSYDGGADRFRTIQTISTLPDAVNKITGMLELIGHQATEGDFPRNFAIAPSGKFMYVANQNSGNITLHSINEKNGKLKSLGQSFAIATPVCIEF